MANPAVLSLVAESLISKTPNVCGGSACIRSTRIPVWSLVVWRNQGVTNHRLLEIYPGLTEDDLEAAWRYQTSHQDEIDADIKSNEDA